MPLRPPIDPFAGRWRVANSPFENSTPFVDQEIADVRMTSVARVSKFGERDDFPGDFLLGTLHSLRDVLDNVPVVIARAECHRRVVATRILA